MAFRTRKLSEWRITIDASEEVWVEGQFLERFYGLEAQSFFNLDVFWLFSLHINTELKFQNGVCWSIIVQKLVYIFVTRISSLAVSYQPWLARPTPILLIFIISLVYL